jgi:hypothetical protein
MKAATRTDRRTIAAEMDQARQAFHRLLGYATDRGMRRRSDDTRWSRSSPRWAGLSGLSGLLGCH